MDRKQNVALIGFMGCGKTTVSRALAAELGWQRLSSDEWITQQEEMSIPEIFARRGEEYFREKERDFLHTCSQRSHIVIDCGGGLVVSEYNMTTLKDCALVIHLTASFEFMWEQIKDDRNRPLLQSANPRDDARDLCEKRQSFYRQADMEVSSETKDISAIVADIVSRGHLERA